MFSHFQHLNHTDEIMKIKLKTTTALLALVAIAGSIGHAEEHGKKHSDRDSQQAVSQFFAGKLMLMNHSTILMSDMAARETSSDEIKQFANMLHQSHAKLNRQLAEIAPDIAAITTLDSAGKIQTTGFRGGLPHERSETVGKDSGVRHADATSADKSFDNPLNQVLSIQRQATENYLQSSTEMLSEYDGQDFDMGFLGFQIGQHTWALAELKAMENIGDENFRKLVSQATENIKQHLEKARELSRKFEGDRE
jgi:predicted outer membrane protein